MKKNREKSSRTNDGNCVNRHDVRRMRGRRR